MAQRILSVDKGSLAARAGLRSGDELLRIGGEPVIDFLDYQALTAERSLEIEARRGGRSFTCHIRKGEYAPLGLNFEKPMMSGMRLCCNRCLFCFVDQLPAHVRESMRVKDDDWRMSMMMGNYVTLTNVSDRELDRIVARRASPLYISVHAVDPELRSRILGTPRGARLASQLQRLAAGGIEFHAQAVLCPGLNDGAALEETIRTLSAIPQCLSLALVPVGLTGHREGLCPLRTYRSDEAQAVLDMAERWRAGLLAARGTRFVFPSDEFYLAAGAPLPPNEAYEDYGQIDDGVGMLRLLETEYLEARDADADVAPPAGCAQLLIGCGVSAAPFLREMLEKHPPAGVQVRVVAVENRFFGSSVTVSGLITGGDLTARLKDELGARVLITECMLRSEHDRFLDDMTLEAAQAALGRKIIPVGRHGWDLYDALCAARDEIMEEQSQWQNP